ncbi:MAG: hypothetical protein CR967_01645 [Proteobacteria bacterium]|nr:MAG: hypothetical protein CR967_01645 [Pseudomonadota bacterium]
MKINTHISILILTLYSLYLGLSSNLYVMMFLPLMLEIYRNRKNILGIFKKLALLNFFILLVAISVYFSNPRLAILIYLRSNMVVLFALMLFYNANYFDIAYGLQRLKLPSNLVSIFYFNGKFIHILSQDLKNFKKNLILRGFKPKVNLLSYKTYANFVGLLFIRAFYRANNLHNILISRGFKGEIYTLKKPEKINKYELILILITLSSLIIKKGVIL